jgi:hypothetical protein
MAVTISNAHIQTFEGNVRYLAQQKFTKIRPFVMEVNRQSESHKWDRLSPGTATQKTTALQTTPNSQGGAWTRRQDSVSTFNTGDTVEPEDIVQMLVDPNSAIARSEAMAMARAVDSLIIAAATGNSTDGAGAAVAFPAGQTIGTGVEKFSFDMVTAVTEKFLLNNIDVTEPKVFVIGPNQMRKMLQLTEATSNDYVSVRTLANQGYISNWMGYDWVVSTLLTQPTPGTDIRVFAMTRWALGLHVAKDIWTQAAQDPSVSFAWRIYSAFTMGACRVEDEQIVQCYISNTL